MVANSLLFSHIWHSIRALSPPQNFFQRIRTVIISFLKQKNFLHVKSQGCQQPRNEGGIAIMNPSKQHSALQIRWLIPLILSSDLAPTPESFATSFMKYTLCALSFAPSPVLPLLFPERRTTDLHRLGCFNSLFNTIGQIDFEIDWTALNASLASEIPLSRHVKKESFFAALRSTSDLLPGLVISSLGFPPPEPEFHSLLSSPLPDGTPIENISTKCFHHIDKLPLAGLPSHYPRTSKSSWTQFWHASIPHPARTILWRLYHSKLSTRSRLHKIMPNTIVDERRMLCGAIESDEHFFWSCPLKQPMWDTLSTRFLDQTPRLTFDEISRPHAISAIMRPHWQLDYFQLIACGVLCLWRTH
ncbi:hypothetical protein G6F25_008065 [Rhizopus arrhizus]|nr:hypothetical protein G6F25_008065 [Rhizopus arrhizus]